MYGGSGPWSHVLKLLSLSISSITPHLTELVNSLMSNTRTHSDVCRLGVFTLVKIAPREVGVVITERLVNLLQDGDILGTNEEDMIIAATPPDELWNPQLRQLYVPTKYRY